MRSTAEQRREGRLIRHRRIRRGIRGTAERPRLAVFRSLKHVYAQIIDDDQAHTLVSISTLEESVGQELARVLGCYNRVSNGAFLVAAAEPFAFNSAAAARRQSRNVCAWG